MSARSNWHLLKSITVESHAPDKSDIPRLLHRAGDDPSQMQKVVHHVVLNLPSEPPVQSSGHELWIGNARIQHYYQFNGRIVFRVYSALELAKLFGKPIRFVTDHGGELRTGVAFPDLSKHPTHLVGRRWQKIFRH
jgi:hypothetical protein